MSEAAAFKGLLADHLIETCPGMVRSMRTVEGKAWGVGDLLLGTVDVDGSDLCQWCVRVWKAWEGGRPR